MCNRTGGPKTTPGQQTNLHLNPLRHGGLHILSISSMFGIPRCSRPQRLLSAFRRRLGRLWQWSGGSRVKSDEDQKNDSLVGCASFVSLYPSEEAPSSVGLPKTIGCPTLSVLFHVCSLLSTQQRSKECPPTEAVI